MKKKDLIKELINQNQILTKENEILNHFRDSSTGLYCIDKNPIKVSKKWIEKHSFRLK